MAQAVGPYRIEVVDPLHTIRLVCDGDEHGVGFDLTEDVFVLVHRGAVANLDVGVDNHRPTGDVLRRRCREIAGERVAGVVGCPPG